MNYPLLHILCLGFLLMSCKKQETPVSVVPKAPKQEAVSYELPITTPPAYKTIADSIVIGSGRYLFAYPRFLAAKYKRFNDSLAVELDGKQQKLDCSLEDRGSGFLETEMKESVILYSQNPFSIAYKAEGSYYLCGGASGFRMATFENRAIETAELVGLEEILGVKDAQKFISSLGIDDADFLDAGSFVLTQTNLTLLSSCSDGGGCTFTRIPYDKFYTKLPANSPLKKELKALKHANNQEVIQNYQSIPFFY